MKIHWPLAALSGTALSLVALAQTTDPATPAATRSNQQGGLVRQSSSFDAELWKLRLSEPNLADRLVQYESLVALARQDPHARAALETWTQDSDPELAWTATLALREVRAAGAAGPRGGLDRGLPHSGFGASDPFGELERMEQRLNEMLQGFGGGLGGQNLQGLQLPPGVHSQSQGYQLEQGPNGVKVTVTELVDGDEQVTTYEGESLEQLLEQHPELRDRVSAGALDPLTGDAFDRFFQGGAGTLRGLDFHGNPGPGPNSGPGLQRVPSPAPLGGQRLPGSVGAVPTDRLGVYVENPRAPGVDPGLRVVEVIPGSLAEALRVRAGDLLIELDGTQLFSTDDIAAALAARNATNEVRLRIADRTGSERLLTWTPPR